MGAYSAVFLCFVAALLPSAQAALVLVERGEARAVIVLPPESGAVSTQAAQELQSCLERISGVRLEIVSKADTAGGARILIGPGPAVKELGIDIPSGFTLQMNEEGFVLRATDTTLVLAGNESGPYRGTIFAVYAFLESLGCRWYFPGPWGEVLPTLDTISVEPVDRVERPDFRFRNIWYSGWMPVSEEDRANFTAWQDHNRMTTLQGMSLPGDGTITRLAPAEQYFDTHPDIYAIGKEGERMKDMLCLSEPETVRIAVQTILDTFRADPEAKTFGFAPPDGHPQCFCERCQRAIPHFGGKGFGEPSLSDSWFAFANAVAREVYKEFPDRWLFTNGYANRVLPPEGIGALSPNLGIQSAMLDSCTFHPIGDPRCWQRQIYQGVLDRWTRELNCVFIYDYDPGKGLENLPFPALHNLQPDFAYFKERGVWGFWTEGQNCWMVTHLNYYIRAKLMWDADANVRELVADYCARFCGPAAADLEKYIWTLEDAVAATAFHENWGRLTPWRTILTPECMTALEDLLVRAEDAAGSTAPYADRIRVYRLVHEHIQAFLAMEGAAERGEFAQAVQQADRMGALRDELAKTDPALLPHTPEWARGHSSTLEYYRETYQKLAHQSDGTVGTRLALLPLRWEFKTDPEERGVLYQWYLPANGQPWDTIDSTLHWEMQGYQDERGWAYAGKAWYRAAVALPGDIEGKPVRLTLGGVYNTGLWVWVNGVLADHRERQDTKNPFDIDVTSHVQPGKLNTVAVLVNTLPPDRNARGGLHRRAFFWTLAP
ncbi:MAG: DUF4838 domain-containing protein [Candidatus Hydrogenedentes bacterium]|nr:DUF4838 domain-containing protein [Candidatus Hydrogenedentota bacterium]